MMKNLSKILILTVMMSCAQQTSIGLKPHSYSDVPKNIVWIQVPGFMYDHVALSLYENPTLINRSIWNQFKCIGNSWVYNLYNIRPNVRNQSLTQLTGNMNIKNDCRDYNSKAVWDYLKVYGYKNLIVEKNTTKRNSLLASLKCKNKDFLKNTSFLLMNRKFSYIHSYKYFHYQTFNQQLKLNTIYLDKTCQTGECVAITKDNLEKSWEPMLHKYAKTFLLIRDYSIQNIINKKKALLYKQKIYELEKLIKYILEKREKFPQLLLVLSSLDGRRISFPKQGRKWKDLFRKGKFITWKNNSLYNNILATGSRSENFCGMYHDNSIIDRFLWLDKNVNYVKKIKNKLLNK